MHFEDEFDVIFVGAGISVNPPTCFPMAGSIISRILRAIAPNENVLANLEILSNSERTEKRNPGDYIRFELLFDSIQQIADQELSILEMVNIFNEPNPLHFFLAEKAINGSIVITTNFDSLIEKAIIRLGREPFSVCELSEYKDWRNIISSGKIPVFKIHGSYMQYDGNEARIASDTVQATFSSITTNTTNLELPGPKRDFLIESTNRRNILIAGYSGSDDLDIMPTFHSLAASSITWLDHDSKPKSKSDFTEQVRMSVKSRRLEQLSSKEKFFSSLMINGKTHIKVFKTNTPYFLLEFLGGKPEVDYSCLEADIQFEHFANFIDRWKEKYLGKDFVKFQIVGHILMNLDHFTEAYDSLLMAQSSCDCYTDQEFLVRNAFLISRVATELLKYEDAEKWIQISLDHLSDLVSTKLHALCLHQYGFVQYKLRNPENALKWYENCEKYCLENNLKEVLSHVLHTKAVICQDRAKYEEAVNLLHESIELSSEFGDIKHITFSFHQLGTAHYDLGLFAESKRFHLQALKITNIIGNNSLLSNTNHELGLLEFLSGNVLESISHFRNSIKINKFTGRKEYTPMHYQHIGIAFMELGKLNLAYKYFLKAEEAYRAMADNDTLSELYAYLVQYYLELPDIKSAIEKAKSAVQMALASGVPDFIERAKFMVGLSVYISGSTKGGANQMHGAMISAKNHKINALILDQIYYLAKFSITPSQFEEVIELVKEEKVIETYLQLGNRKRYKIVKEYIEKLEKQ